MEGKICSTGAKIPETDKGLVVRWGWGEVQRRGSVLKGEVYIAWSWFLKYSKREVMWIGVVK